MPSLILEYSMSMSSPATSVLQASSTHYRNSKLCRVSDTLGKGYHSANDTRQRFPWKSLLCRVSYYGHSAKVLPSALILGKEATWRHPGPAVCRVSNGRHSAKFQTLPSVQLGHSAKSPRQGISMCLVCRVSR